MEDQKQIILFDGVCNLCNSTVQFIIKRDHKAKFHFASLQSAAGQSLLHKFNLPANDFQSFIYIKGDTYYSRSSGAINVMKDLGHIWQLAYIFIIIPPFIRDFVYNFIAKNRYKMFGRQESCMIPTLEIKQRFLQ